MVVWSLSLGFLYMLMPFVRGGIREGCPREMIACPSNGICIPKNWQCDGQNDCSGGEDEDPAICGGLNNHQGYNTLSQPVQTLLQWTESIQPSYNWVPPSQAHNSGNQYTKTYNAWPEEISTQGIYINPTTTYHPRPYPLQTFGPWDNQVQNSWSSQPIQDYSVSQSFQSDWASQSGQEYPWVSEPVQNPWVSQPVEENPWASELIQNSWASQSVQVEDPWLSQSAQVQDPWIQPSPNFNTFCQNGFFVCNGRCVSNSLKCNGRRECGNINDEDWCTPIYKPTTAPIVECSDNEIKCYNGKCISKYQLCDGRRDCPHYEDEFACEFKKDKLATYKCVEKCLDIPLPNCTVQAITETTVRPQVPFCDYGYVFVFDRCLKTFIHPSKSWSDAKSTCIANGAALVEIDNGDFFLELQAFLSKPEHDAHSFWTGAFLNSHTNEWQWSNSKKKVHLGAPLWSIADEGTTYKQQPSGHPNEHCGLLQDCPFQYMNDKKCNKQYPYVCQKNAKYRKW